MPEIEHIGDAEFAGLERETIGDNEIERLTAQHLPIILPWSRRNVRLGTCYQSHLQRSSDPWVKETPFILADLFMIPKAFDREHGTQATYKSVSTTRECETGDHLSLGFGVGVGLPFLASISVKGTYDRDVQKNNDSEKQSIRSSVRAGSVVLQRSPRLTTGAIKMLKYGGGYPSFCDRYGDYYLAGYRVGGETGILISASSFSSKQVEKFGIKVTLEVLFLEASKTWNQDFYEFNSGRSLKLLGYDTLEGTYHTDSISGSGVDLFRSQALSLVSQSQSMLNRVEAALDGLEMFDATQLTNEQCDRLIEAGLVVELLLQPMHSLRDVKRWTSENNII